MHLFKHDNNTDVAAVFFNKERCPDKKAYKTKVMWFNIVNPDHIYAIKLDTVWIKIEDMPKWRLYVPNV